MNETNTQYDEDREQLVAYLDGELEAHERRAVEERLAGDEAYRVEMQRLEHAWDALDVLPRTTVDEKFTHTTVEMVTLEVEEQLERQRTELPRRRRRQWLFGVAAVAVAAGVGFVTVTLALPRENEQLVDDLPVLENLDAYLQVEDIEVLRELDAQELFPDEAENGDVR